MLPAFRAGAGGPIGAGTQWVSWVSLEDVLGLVQRSLLDERVRGPLNAVAPGVLRQADFARTLGRVLGRPAVLTLPAAAVRALFGEMGEAALLGSQRVEPAAALSHGFRFLHPELEGALRFHLGRTREGPQFSATDSD
jgi:NAD dependent epimerase/dehydratase family enzyme